MHRNINLRKELIARAALENILNLRMIVNFAFDNFVESAEVGNPAHPSILLGDEKGGRQPFGSTAGREDSFVAKTLELVLEHL